MAEYYSTKLREIAKELRSGNQAIIPYIYANIIEGAAGRIDDLQHDLAARIVQVARLQDELDKLRKKDG